MEDLKNKKNLKIFTKRNYFLKKYAIIYVLPPFLEVIMQIRVNVSCIGPYPFLGNKIFLSSKVKILDTYKIYVIMYKEFNYRRK